MYGRVLAPAPAHRVRAPALVAAGVGEVAHAPEVKGQLDGKLVISYIHTFKQHFFDI